MKTTHDKVPRHEFRLPGEPVAARRDQLNGRIIHERGQEIRAVSRIVLCK
jgi:hypothetical protein